MPGASALQIKPLKWLDLTRQDRPEPVEAISPFDRAMAYGDGLFATLRVLGMGDIALLDTHLSRLVQGAARLGVMVPMDDIKIRLQQAGKVNPGRGLKLLISRGIGGRGYQPPAEPQPMAILTAFDIPRQYSEWQRDGIALATSRLRLGRQPRLAGIKHLNRLEQVLIRAETPPDWAQDWLVYDSVGELVEASMANLFFIVGDCAYTPWHTHAGVSGVVRQAVCEALLAQNIRIKAQGISREILELADSVLMTNSLIGIVDVVRIDNNNYAPFAGTAAVRERLKLNT